mmetsp:Transcript_19433/g.41858  ORF Transcript_19433/g.41858 Transcript_19433/m.41858 type:complete len:89 (-) Transcript_19433:31-297(-)
MVVNCAANAIPLLPSAVFAGTELNHTKVPSAEILWKPGFATSLTSEKNKEPSFGLGYSYVLGHDASAERETNKTEQSKILLHTCLFLQ